MNKVKEEKEIKSAYKISLEIVNKTERGIFKSLDIFGLDLSFLKIKHIEFLPKLVQKIIVFLIQIITQFHQIIIKPFIITLYGVLVSIKDYYIKFTILLVIIMQIKKHAVIPYFQVENEISLVVTTLLFIHVVLFKKIPSHGKTEIKLINKLNDELTSYDLDEKQWGLVLNNINLFKENSNKRIVFISSLATFLWAIYLLVFKLFQSNLPKLKIEELLDLIGEPLTIYIGVFLLIRIYSKVYKYIFEMINIAINEILFTQSIKE